MPDALFGGWGPVLRTAMLAVLAYAALVLVLRGFGKRTLSKMNAFDFVVTIAIGSMLGTIVLSRDTSLVQGTVGMIVLIGLQFVVTWLSVRLGWVRRVVTGEPQMLFYNGSFVPSSLRRARVTEAEVLAAVRASGKHDLDEVRAVVLETDASFSVIGSDGEAGASSLVDVRGKPDQSAGELP